MCYLVWIRCWSFPLRSTPFLDEKRTYPDGDEVIDNPSKEDEAGEIPEE